MKNNISDSGMHPAEGEGIGRGLPCRPAALKNRRPEAGRSREEKPAPDNGPFWEDKGNPLSSKGN